MCVFFWNASVVGEIVPHASPRVIFRTDNSGIGFLYAPRRAPSADGTTLKIADREYPPESTQSDDVLAAFYATDMTVGQILPGTDLWAVERTPADIVQTAKWNVGGDGGRLRTLAVKELSATEASIEQFDLNDPDAPQVILNVVRVNDTYELRSLSFESHFNTLWIFFGPLLPLPRTRPTIKGSSPSPSLKTSRRTSRAAHWRFKGLSMRSTCCGTFTN